MARTALRAAICTAALVLLCYGGAGRCQTPPSTSGAPPSTGKTPEGSGGPTTGATTSASGSVISIKKEMTGDFTYRFVTEKDATAAPAPLPAPAANGAPIPVALPSTVPAKSAILEVVDKSRGNVARIPVAGTTTVALNETAFKYLQTVFVSVSHDGKPVTDVLLTIADKTHKFSMAWLLKAADKGVAQFGNVPLGVELTVAVNGAGHPSVSSINTLTPDHPADGYHWPAITVDWPNVATVAVPAPLTTGAAAPADTRTPTSGASEHRDEGGGFLSSVINVVLGLAVIGGLVYLAFWAFNKGHVKTMLDKAGINTAEIPAGGGVQPSPFDKPAKAPIQPITEGTADPFGGISPLAASAAVVPSGPRLVATAGSYSGTIFPISGVSTDIGRDAANPVPLPNDSNSSRRHATIVISGGEFTVVDNGSSNGTYLNGVRIPANTPHALRSGDELQIGMTRFRFEA